MGSLYSIYGQVLHTCTVRSADGWNGMTAVQRRAGNILAWTKAEQRQCQPGLETITFVYLKQFSTEHYMFLVLVLLSTQGPMQNFAILGRCHKHYFIFIKFCSLRWWSWPLVFARLTGLLVPPSTQTEYFGVLVCNVTFKYLAQPMHPFSSSHNFRSYRIGNPQK